MLLAISFVRCIVSLKQNFLNQGAGAAQPNISREKIINTIVPLPPLAEQRRIVAKIDELMARCDELEKLKTERDRKQITVHKAALNRLLTAKNHSDFQTSWHFITQHFGELYSVKENVAELRKAILQVAVMGKLVPQDPNDQPASELLKEIKNWKTKMIRDKVFLNSSKSTSNQVNSDQYELPKSWYWTHIGIMCGSIVPNRDKPKSFSGGYPWITLSNFDSKGIKLLKNNSDIGLSPQEVQQSNARIMPKNSVLMSCVGRFGLETV